MINYSINLAKMSQQRNITLYHLFIKNQKQIGLKFYPDKIIQTIIKGLPNARWSNTHHMAYILNTSDNLNLIYNDFKGLAWINGNYFFDKKNDLKAINPKSINEFRTRKTPEGYIKCPEEFLIKLELKHYAFNTCKSYISLFETFINDHKNKELTEINENDIRIYLQSLVQANKSESYLNLMINSIKFYYETVLEMPNRFYKIERPRKREKLPKVISLEEVKKMIETTTNIKHKCILSLLYSAGLRRSELLNLKIENIDSKRMIINIKDGKRNKDRITILSTTVLKDLRIYVKEYKPSLYLFEGINGKQYSPESVLQIVKNAARKARINQKVTPHMLRHSFATHLLENGTNLRYIQSLLGHNSSKTTEIYTQVATNHLKLIKSPIELLNLQ